MKEKIERFLKLLTQLTKEEADMIEEIVSWDDETRAAYKLAKELFEDGD